MRTTVRVAGFVLLVLALASAGGRAWARQSVSDADIKRLELAISDAKQDLAALKSRDAAKSELRPKRRRIAGPSI